jgi:hypothetical protein
MINNKLKFGLSTILFLMVNTIAVNAQAESVYIRAKHSDKCLHVPGDTANSFANGIRLTQWSCINQRNVQWEIEPYNDEGLVKLKSTSTGKCAQVNGGSRKNGAIISQWDCVNQANVLWTIKPVEDGYVNIVNHQTGKCLQVDGLSQVNNGTISQWTCVNQPNVKWKIVEASN